MTSKDKKSAVSSAYITMRYTSGWDIVMVASLKELFICMDMNVGFVPQIPMLPLTHFLVKN